MITLKRARKHCNSVGPTRMWPKVKVTGRRSRICLLSLSWPLAFSLNPYQKIIMHPTPNLLSRLSSHITSTPFKRAQTGIFGGKCIQFGNSVPFSKHKTRRTWLPNVQRKGLKSELLDGKEINVKVTTRALRTIKKVRSDSFFPCEREC